jgi:ketosteroid isomerase-like protein
MGEEQTAQTRAIVMDLHRAYRDGNAQRVAGLIHDDIDWVIYGPKHVFPFEGPRRGKKEVLEVLAAIGECFELKRYEHDILVCENDRAAVMSRTAFVQRATGRTLSLRLVNFIRIGDGKIIEFREISDTFDVVEQALGYHLAVPSIGG